MIDLPPGSSEVDIGRLQLPRQLTGRGDLPQSYEQPNLNNETDRKVLEVFKELIIAVRNKWRARSAESSADRIQAAKQENLALIKEIAQEYQLQGRITIREDIGAKTFIFSIDYLGNKIDLFVVRYGVKLNLKAVKRKLESFKPHVVSSDVDSLEPTGATEPVV